MTLHADTYEYISQWWPTELVTSPHHKFIFLQPFWVWRTDVWYWNTPGWLQYSSIKNTLLVWHQCSIYQTQSQIWATVSFYMAGKYHGECINRKKCSCSYLIPIRDSKQKYRCCWVSLDIILRTQLTWKLRLLINRSLKWVQNCMGEPKRLNYRTQASTYWNNIEPSCYSNTRIHIYNLSLKNI